MEQAAPEVSRVKRQRFATWPIAAALSGGDDFFSVMGSDARTPLGAGNLSTVAGGLARSNTPGGSDRHAEFQRVSLTLGTPVPSLDSRGLAAAGVLLLLTADHALRHRLSPRRRR